MIFWFQNPSNDCAVRDVNYPMKTFIYALVDPVTNLVRYVGKTVNPSRRFGVHICDKGECHRARWIAKLRADGLVPRFEILETFDDPSGDHWQAREIYWIGWMRDEGYKLTNIKDGGAGGVIPKCSTRQRLLASFTPERRAKIAERNAARIWTEESLVKKRNIKFSDETRAKMRAAFTPERLAKMALLGRSMKRSPESIAKMAAKIRGTKWSPERRAKIAATWTPEKRISTGLQQAQAGRKNTPETIAKMRESARRHERSPETGRYL